jgi:small subunit ribosomal protein S11
MTDKSDNKKKADNSAAQNKDRREREEKNKAAVEDKAAQSQGAAGESKSAPADKPANAAAAEAAKTARAARSKTVRNVPAGIAHINATFNNTHVTITDLKGGVLAWSSAGRMGFKGARKSTAYAATVVAQEAARMVAPYRMQELEVRVQGPGSGRESAIRAFQSAGFVITVIKDVTPMPHNGCRPRKRRRV